MATIMVTGSTGHLGTPTAAALRAEGHTVVGVTRRGSDGGRVGDLLDGSGMDSALEGISAVVHLATMNGRSDIRMAENLVTACHRAGVRHLVLVSIVGIDGIPLGFYRDRLRIEDIVQQSGIPFTIQRSTQFHSFVDSLFSAQKYSPVILAPVCRLQPIAVEDVAACLAALAVGEPRAHVPDIGGPQTLSSRELLALWKRATGSRRPTLTIRLPGVVGAAYTAGANLVYGEPFGRGTFGQYLANTYDAAEANA